MKTQMGFNIQHLKFFDYCVLNYVIISSLFQTVHFKNTFPSLV